MGLVGMPDDLGRGSQALDPNNPFADNWWSKYERERLLNGGPPGDCPPPPYDGPELDVASPKARSDLWDNDLQARYRDLDRVLVTPGQQGYRAFELINLGVAPEKGLAILDGVCKEGRDGLWAAFAGAMAVPPVVVPRPPLHMGVPSANSTANAAQYQLLNNRLIAEEISGGHAFGKHVLTQGEFPGWIRTRAQFQQHVESVLNNPTAVRQLSGGRTAYWHEPTGTVVIRNPRAVDGGTAFQPRDGVRYFNDPNRLK